MTGTLWLLPNTGDRLPFLNLKEMSKQLNGSRMIRYAEIRYRNGVVQKQENYTGSSYLSQSTGFLATSDDVVEVSFVNAKNQKRVVKF